MPTEQANHNLQIGVINPFALAEIKIGKKINWKEVENPEKLVEEILEFPYEKLFDPKYDSPLYAGLKYDEHKKVMVRDEKDPAISAKTPEAALLSVLKRTGKVHPSEKIDEKKTSGRQYLTTLLQREGAKNDSDVPIVEFEKAKKAFEEAQPELISHYFSKVAKYLDISGGGGGGGGFNWLWEAPFFIDAVNPLDIIQGGLGDCYFVAALASVAWAHPFTIMQRTRQTDNGGQFATPGEVDLITLWNTTNSKWDRVEVTELLPMQPPGNTWIYARDDNLNETWVPIYEKAYAMWRTGNTNNYPNYAPIAGGDPVGAEVSLTGLTSAYYGTNGDTAHNIWQRVRSHSLSYKTFDPMVAWTYPSDAAAPTPINYSNAHIVANHAYSILGWHYFNGQEYIVLRNPWGSTEATLNIEGGAWSSYDGSFWYPLGLSAHGVFALRSDTFQQYYAGYGVVTGNDTLPSF